jgi:hypothetical protein
MSSAVFDERQAAGKGGRMKEKLCLTSVRVQDVVRALILHEAIVFVPFSAGRSHTPAS